MRSLAAFALSAVIFGGQSAAAQSASAPSTDEVKAPATYLVQSRIKGIDKVKIAKLSHGRGASLLVSSQWRHGVMNGKVIGRCREPETIAYAAVVEGIQSVIVCENNVNNLRVVIWDFSWLAMYDFSLINETDLGAYMSMHADRINMIRNRDGINYKSYATMCPLAQYLYLKSIDRTEKCFGGYFPNDPGWRNWESSHHIYNNEVPKMYRRINGSATNGVDDRVLRDRMVQEIYDGAISNTIDFVLLHELGHIQNGDTLEPPANACVSEKREFAADDYALRIMKATDRIDSSVEVQPMVAWWSTFSAIVLSRDPDTPSQLKAERIRSPMRSMLQSRDVGGDAGRQVRAAIAAAGGMTEIQRAMAAMGATSACS